MFEIRTKFNIFYLRHFSHFPDKNSCRLLLRFYLSTNIKKLAKTSKCGIMVFLKVLLYLSLICYNLFVACFIILFYF